VVGVEDDHEVGVDVCERVVEVAGLGVLARLTSEVARTEPVGELAHLRPDAVVEQPGLVVAVHRHGRRERRQDDLARFVVARDEHRDPALGYVGGGRRERPGVPERERGQADPEDGVCLERPQEPRHRQRVGVEGEECAPAEVGQADEERHRRDRLAPTLATLVRGGPAGGAVGGRRGAVGGRRGALGEPGGRYGTWARRGRASSRGVHGSPSRGTPRRATSVARRGWTWGVSGVPATGRLRHHRAWRCHRCRGAPVVGLWWSSDGGDPGRVARP
jgi:hypothetical protein